MEARFITLSENTRDEKVPVIKKVKILLLKEPLLRNIFSFANNKEKLKTHICLNKFFSSFIVDTIESIDIIKETPDSYLIEKLQRFKNLKSIKVYKDENLPEIIDWLNLFPPEGLEKLLFSEEIMRNSIERVCKSIYLINLKELKLDGIKFGVAGAASLSKANFPRLEILSLNSANIESSGVEYLTKAKFASNLKKLNLNSNKIGIDGSKHLTGGKFPSLRVLFLRKNNIGVGLKYLSNGDFMHLEILWLEYNKISNSDLENVNEKCFPSLKELSVFYNDIKNIDDEKQKVMEKFSGNKNFKLYL